jgi:hypothetical protein
MAKSEKMNKGPFTGGGYSELITPINEEGNRTGNDPDTHNVPSAIDPPDPMGFTHGLFGGKGRNGSAPPKG